MRLISRHSGNSGKYRNISVLCDIIYVHVAVSLNRISLTMDAIQDLDFALSYALQQLRCEAMILKPQQRESVKCTYEGKDVFLWLPTGLGKSICYKVLPFVFDVKLA